MIHIYIYINNQDNILTSGYNGDMKLLSSQTQLPNLNICDNSIKYDENYSILDGSSYILYKYDISNMDSTSFSFNGLYIKQQYQNDSTTYYITHIEIKNNSGFETTYCDNAPYFNAGTMYLITCPPIGKDKVSYININFTQHPRVTSTPLPSTPGPTNKLEYQIYLINCTNKSHIEECFTTLEPDFKLGFNFSNYSVAAIPITYNISKRTLETSQSFIDSIEFNIIDNYQVYIDIILNTGGYTLKEITKDISDNNLVINDCTSQDYKVTNNIISIDASNILYNNSLNSSKKVGCICISNKLSTQSYLNTSYNAINTSYNSYIQ